MPRRRQSNVRRATSRATRTDDPRGIENYDSRIGISELHYRLSENGALQALDRTLKDLLENQNILLILLSGAFRQTLPIISWSTVVDELNACLVNSSNFLRHLKTLQLTTNMRVFLQQDQTEFVISKQLEMVKSPLTLQPESSRYPHVLALHSL